ncbi:hypothetical protein SAY87_029626 [Trapa incisa]|uniref:Patatin n=1 Tax=Trapa incisa TaxID=236973 RepID=A0AAN7K8J2_9MYRT|nr:hypothetical protein SAY87_029626 [Trapa incisa]
MAFNGLLEMDQGTSIDTNKLSYEIFSILEKKFLFGANDDSRLWIPRQVSRLTATTDADTALHDLLTGIQIVDSSSSFPFAAAGGGARPRVRILSIDGGGCSSLGGVLPCRALTYLERAIRQRSNNPAAAMADYFDVVAGTGIGGVVAAMLFATKDGAQPAFGAEDTWRLLVEHERWMPSNGGGRDGFMQRLFGRRRGRGGVGVVGFEEFLRETFSGGGGGELTLKDTLKPLLIPCYDISTAAPFLFSRADALESDGYDFRLWDVCRATSTELGRIEPVLMRSVDGKNRCVGLDGGLVMSNPTAAAITHVLHNKNEFPHVRGVEDMLVLSLGTGQVIKADRGRPGYDYGNLKGWKANAWAEAAIRITRDGSADLVDQAVANCLRGCRAGGYVRIQANGSNLFLDGSRVETEPGPWDAKKLANIAEEMLKQKNVESVLFGGKSVSDLTNYEKLDTFAADLVTEHNGRRNLKASSVALGQESAGR